VILEYRALKVKKVETGLLVIQVKMVETV